jgi:hypothetical protein
MIAVFVHHLGGDVVDELTDQFAVVASTLDDDLRKLISRRLRDGADGGSQSHQTRQCGQTVQTHDLASRMGCRHKR